MTKDYLKLDDKDEPERNFVERQFFSTIERAKEKGLVVDLTKGLAIKHLSLFTINGESVNSEDLVYVLTPPKKPKKSIFADPMNQDLNMEVPINFPANAINFQFQPIPAQEAFVNWYPMDEPNP